jgi:hypothetical protein
MKTLGKLKIDKVEPLNNEELLSLRGGSDQYWCLYTIPETQFYDWFICSGSCSPSEATYQCNQYYYGYAECDCELD